MLNITQIIIKNSVFMSMNLNLNRYCELDPDEQYLMPVNETINFY